MTLPLDFIRMRVLLDALQQFLDTGVAPGGENLAGTLGEAAALEMLSEIEDYISGND